MTQPSKQPPNWLSAEAKEFWTEYAPMLERSGALTPADYPAFLSMALSYGHMIEAAKLLASEGIAIGATGHDKGTKKKHPAVQTYRDSEGSFRAISQQFGLSPLSRSKVKLTEPEDDDDGVLD